MRPPRPTAGPRGGDRQAAPPRPSGGGAWGPEGPAHSPPPLPLRPKSGRRQTKETAAPQPPRRGRCTRAEGAPRPRQAPPVNRPHAPALPAADRQRTGGAQDGANGAAPSEAGLGKAGGANQGGGVPPPPPPAALTHWRPTGPRPTRGRPATPTARVYPGGARRRQQMAGRCPTGRGGRGRRSGPSPPPLPPPTMRATGATLRPPGAEGRPPLPQQGPRRGRGGLRLNLHTARPSAASRDQAWGRGRAAHQNSMEAPPPMTPPVTIAHSGGAEGGFRSEGAPGGAVLGPPLTPPPPRAAPRPRTNAHTGGECAEGGPG